MEYTVARVQATVVMGVRCDVAAGERHGCDLVSLRGAGSENGHPVETGPGPCRADAVSPGA